MIEIRRRTLVRRELWFDEPWNPKGADLLVFYHWKEPVNAAAFREVHSLEIDLARDSGEIFKGFEPSTRNQVNRAIKDGLQFKFWPKPPREVVDEFIGALGKFASERGIGGEEPAWMHEYAAQNALLLTQAAAIDGRPLSWHSYAHVGATVRQLHSVSVPADATAEERRLVSKANRFLHWMDMLECLKVGVDRFDFGGWYAGSADEKLLRVNEFKEQFGGVRTLRYHSMMAASAKGAAFLHARKLLKGESGLVHFV